MRQPGSGWNTRVMEFLVGKKRSIVALHAVRFADEKPQACFFVLCQNPAGAIAVGIEASNIVIEA